MDEMLDTHMMHVLFSADTCKNELQNKYHVPNYEFIFATNAYHLLNIV